MPTYRIDETEEVCANCAHYRQHYRKERHPHGMEGFVPVNAGHCVEPRVKDRRPYDTCERFMQAA